MSSAIIVCPVDSSETTWRTAAYALDVARFRGAELHLVYLPGVRAEKPRPVDACTADTTADRADATPLRHVALVDISSQLPHGAAAGRCHEARAIATYARSKGADLIVIGAYYGAARRWRRSSWVARTLGRSAPCPVLIVPHDVSPLPSTSRARSPM
jgi:nucleotide-binding universal stress UspA family protein